MKMLNNIKLRNKLLICYGSLMIFAVSLAGLLTYQKIQSYIYNQSSKSYSQTLNQVAMNIDYKMNTHQELLNPYITNHKFIAALNTTYYSPADYTYQYLDNLRSIFELERRYPSIKNIIIYKKNDTMPDIGTYPDKPSISDAENTIIDIAYAEQRAWYQKHFTNLDETDLAGLIALSNASIWTVNDNRSLISIIKPIMYNNDKLVGIVEMQLRLKDIFQDGMFSEHSPEELFYMANDDGEIRFQSNPELPPIAAPSENPMFDNESAGSWLAEGDRTKKLVLYQTNRHSGWKYVLEVPMDSLMLSAQSIRNFTVAILIGSILISILLTLAISRVLSRRISLLAKHMERQEDLTLEIGPSVDGRDEIGMLMRNYNRMIKRIRELIEELRTSQQLQKETEIKSLQAQINPHFLYNTLATINWMAADNETKKIIDMVNNLATFYRLSLNSGKEYLRISEEIRHVQTYVEIQKIRLEDMINITFDIEDKILTFHTLKLILQPFVENAILHGAEHKDGTTNIAIKGHLSHEESCVIFEIIDDGIGMDLPSHNQYVSNGGYGIHNVNEKIQLQHGHQYGVRLFSKLGIGTRVVIRIPVLE
ncbi:sensor histidine kinase [Paenibacillus sp. PAMC21692]|uniref:cache domain-containing sensor histidine kinase n=1 Tax=Paenibacillus sp. PAMC21692 TaxID=2762320 RepID=UPI00164D64FA|nr:sensor histidine kinase [Paenibacillus sp. PAMC21692]QNK57243.1 sensor histidine kinase [Paenibacillus sp. PAMC21692]